MFNGCKISFILSLHLPFFEPVRRMEQGGMSITNGSISPCPHGYLKFVNRLNRISSSMFVPSPRHGKVWYIKQFSRCELNIFPNWNYQREALERSSILWNPQVWIKKYLFRMWNRPSRHIVSNYTNYTISQGQLVTSIASWSPNSFLLDGIYFYCHYVCC